MKNRFWEGAAVCSPSKKGKRRLGPLACPGEVQPCGVPEGGMCHACGACVCGLPTGACRTISWSGNGLAGTCVFRASCGGVVGVGSVNGAAGEISKKKKKKCSRLRWAFMSQVGPRRYVGRRAAGNWRCSRFWVFNMKVLKLGQVVASNHARPSVCPCWLAGVAREGPVAKPAKDRT